MYTFSTVQILHISLQEAWEFFTSPGNLARITPPCMGFEILTDLNETAIYPGMEIDYKIRPLAGFPMKWKTLITEVKPMCSFTDIQLKGPYAIWEHTHRFNETRTGIVQMTDELKYKLPLSIVGKAAHWLFVKKRIHEIFTYRRQTLEKIFNSHVTMGH